MDKMPMVAYIHKDTDMKDAELVDLMCQFEKEPKKVGLVLKLVEKRARMNDHDIAKMWLKYAVKICDDADDDNTARIGKLAADLNIDLNDLIDRWWEE